MRYEINLLFEVSQYHLWNLAYGMNLIHYLKLYLVWTDKYQYHFLNFVM